MFLHIAAQLVGSRPAGSPATAGMSRGDSPGKLAISGEDDPLAPRSARMHYSLLGEALALTPLLVLRRSVRGAPFGLWGILMLETAGLGCGCRALGSSVDGSAAAATGKALVAPIARLSGDANGCLHYPPADT